MRQIDSKQTSATAAAMEQRPFQKRESLKILRVGTFMLAVTLLLSISPTQLSAQTKTAKTPAAKPDIITLLTGDDIEAKVEKVGETEVEYKKWSYRDGPTYTVKKSEIFRVCYANGEKDMFFKVGQQPVAAAPAQQQAQGATSSGTSPQPNPSQANSNVPVIVATDIPGVQQGACYAALFSEMKTKGFNVQSDDYAAKKGLEKIQGIAAGNFIKDHSKNVTPDDKYIVLLVTMKSMFNCAWTFRTFDMSTGQMLAEDKMSTSTGGRGNWGDVAREALNFFLAKHPTLEK